MGAGPPPPASHPLSSPSRVTGLRMPAALVVAAREEPRRASTKKHRIGAHPEHQLRGRPACCPSGRHASPRLTSTNTALAARGVSYSLRGARAGGVVVHPPAGGVRHLLPVAHSVWRAVAGAVADALLGWCRLAWWAGVGAPSPGLEGATARWLAQGRLCKWYRGWRRALVVARGRGPPSTFARGAAGTIPVRLTRSARATPRRRGRHSLQQRDPPPPCRSCRMDALGVSVRGAAAVCLSSPRQVDKHGCPHRVAGMPSRGSSDRQRRGLSSTQRRRPCLKEGPGPVVAFHPAGVCAAKHHGLGVDPSTRSVEATLAAVPTRSWQPRADPPRDIGPGLCYPLAAAASTPNARWTPPPPTHVPNPPRSTHHTPPSPPPSQAPP